MCGWWCLGFIVIAIVPAWPSSHRTGSNRTSSLEASTGRVHAENVAGPGPHARQPQEATREIAEVGYGRRPNQSSSRFCGEALGGNVPLGPSPYAPKASISSRCGSTSRRTLATTRGSRV